MSDPITLPAITIHQPWASLVAGGAKPYETRDYPPPAKYIGQRIAIHAGKNIDELVSIQDYLRASLRAEHPDTETEAIITALKGAGYARLTELPLGSVVATAVLDGAYQCGEPSTAYGGRPCWTVRQRFGASRSINSNVPVDHFGNYTPGRWAWRMADVQPLPTPIPARGKQGWWTWTAPAEPLLPA